MTRLNHEKHLHLETAIIDSTQLRAFGGGEASGPSPVDHREKGKKYTLPVDRDGVPLVIRAAAPSCSDHREILPAVVEYPLVGRKWGRPRTHPEKLYAHAGFDCEATQSLLAWLGIEPHLRHRHDDHGSHLGRVRWVVERTISWIKGLRRMRIRYDRSGTLIDACTTIADAVVCSSILMEANR